MQARPRKRKVTERASRRRCACGDLRPRESAGARLDSAGDRGRAAPAEARAAAETRRDPAAATGGRRRDHRRDAGGPAPGGRGGRARRRGRRDAAAQPACPSGCPSSPGLAVAARYVAGSADAQVGGDWYDVIALRDGQAGIAIGDVVGHGLDAAARMARLQNALRAYALEGLRPSLVLERMNGFAREVAGGPMATLLYGVIDPEEGRLRLATAGHPPVLVIGPDGERLLRRGPGRQPARRRPVSRPTRSRRSRWSRARPCCSTPMGWSSARTPRSTRAWSGCASSPPASPTASRRALRGAAAGALREAAAARRRRPARGPARAGARGERIELTLRGRARVAGADAARARRAGCARPAPSDAEAYETLVAGGEACANAVAHAYPAGEASYVVEARRLDSGVEVRVRDFGSWRAPRSGSQGRGPGADRGADGRGRDRSRPRPAPPCGCAATLGGARRRRAMRDRLAGFEFEQRDGVLVAAVEGEIDGSNAADLRLALAERLPSTASALVLDLSQVTLPRQLRRSTCSSTSAGGSPPGARRSGSWSPTDAPTRRVLELCAMDTVAPMDRDLENALAALAGAPDLSSAGAPAGRLAQTTRVAADHEARKRSIARSSRLSTRWPAQHHLADAIGEGLQQSSSLRPIGRLTRARESDHAEQPPAADHRRRDQRPAAARAGAGVRASAGRGARARPVPAVPRRARQLRERGAPSAAGSATRRSESPSSSAR